MATISGSAMGSFNGKLGNAVSYQLNGKNVVRSLPVKSKKNKQGTVDQNANRSKFTQIQHFLRPILHFIRVGFNMEARSRQMSAHNVAKSYNLLNAFSPKGDIDYSKILVSYGNLAPAVDANVVKDDDGLHFTWSHASDKGFKHNNDQVMLLAYSPADDSAAMMFSGARREAGHEKLSLVEINKGFAIHIWIAFISDDRQQVSMSTYLGELTS